MVELATNFSDETFTLMSRFAKEEKVNLSDVMREKMIEWLEDLQDLRDAKAEHEEYLKNPESFLDFMELEAKWMK